MLLHPAIIVILSLRKESLQFSKHVIITPSCAIVIIHSSPAIIGNPFPNTKIPKQHPSQSANLLAIISANRSSPLDPTIGCHKPLWFNVFRLFCQLPLSQFVPESLHYHSTPEYYHITSETYHFLYFEEVFVICKLIKVSKSILKLYYLVWAIQLTRPGWLVARKVERYGENPPNKRKREI